MRVQYFSFLMLVGSFFVKTGVPSVAAQVEIHINAVDSMHVRVSLQFSEIEDESPVLLRHYVLFRSHARHPEVSVLDQDQRSLSKAGGEILRDIPVGAESAPADRLPASALPERFWRLDAVGEEAGWFFHRLTVFSVVGGETPMRLRTARLQLRGENLQPIKRIEAPEKRSHSSLAMGKQALPQTVPPGSNPAWPPLKLHVDSTRVVWIPRSLLKDAGWDVAGIDPRHLRVSTQGREIPVTVLGEADGKLERGDGISFSADVRWRIDAGGMKQAPAYGQEGVYWIDVASGPALRLAQRAAFGPTRPAWNTRYPRSAPETRHFEANTVFHRLPYAIDVTMDDHWLWGGSVLGGEKRAHSFTLDATDAFALSTVALRVRLRGQTQMAGDHGVMLYLNNTFVGSGSWQGQEVIEIAADAIPPSALNEKGAQTLTIVNQSTQGALAQLYLDGFEITYPRLLEASHDAIHFHAPVQTAGQWVRFEIDGFTSPHIHVERPGQASFFGGTVTSQRDSTGLVSYTLTFEDEVVDPLREYLVYAEKHRWTPDTLAVYTPSDPVSAAASADYIVIVPHDSLGAAPLQPLIDLRVAQGRTPFIVSYPELVNACNHGIPHPVAIRHFLSALYLRNPALQRYVLLVGDGHLDYRQTPEQSNHLPVPVYQTEKYGGAAADHWYVCLSGDDALPEMAIGRLPVRDAAQLGLVVDKLVDYGKNAKGGWRNRYLLIGSGGHNDIFRKQSEALIRTVFSPALAPRRLYLSGPLTDPNVGGTEDLLRCMRDGVAMINFRGHGGGAIWADAGLLDLDDIALLENRHKLPFITSMTCFTADFSSSRQCLGEALLTETEAGASAFWGASGVGWVYNDYYLLTELQTLVAADPGRPVGALIQSAKTQYLNRFFGRLAVGEAYQFNLLGDPAMLLTVPSDRIDLSLASRALLPGETLACQGSTEAVLRLDATLNEAHGRPYVSSTFNPGTPSWQFEMRVPEGQTATEHGLRVYGWDETSAAQAHAYLPFRVQRAWFDSLCVVPEFPKDHEPVAVVADIEAKDGVRRVWCELFVPLRETRDMQATEKPGRFLTTEPLGPFPAGATLQFAIGVEDGTGRISRSDTVSRQIPMPLDLLARSLDFDRTGGLRLQAAIENRGAVGSGPVEVLFETPATGWSARDTVALSAGETAEARVNYQPWMGTAAVTVTVDPMGKLAESQRANNTLTRQMENGRFPVSPEYGSEIAGVHGWVGLPGRLLARVTADAAPDSLVLALSEDAETANTWTLTLQHHQAPAVLSQSGELMFYRPLSDTAAGSRVYLHESALDRWVAVQAVCTDSAWVIPFSRSGRYRLSSTADQSPPRIEVQAGGKPLSRAGYVASRALISVLLEDDSGVDARRDKIELYLDEQRVAGGSILLADTLSDPTQVALTFRPTLLSGMHSLRIHAADVHGNVAQSGVLEFKVGNGLDIEYLGNHPNPFRRETVFAYVLTDAAERAVLKIYTVDGRLIRTFSSPDMGSADYHEIPWDGLDSWGEAVANGVYFFRIKVSATGRSRAYTGKIAKVR